MWPQGHTALFATGCISRLATMSAAETKTPVTNVTAVARAVDAVKIYGSGDTEVRALDGVSVSLPAGRFTAIMGPSGSGKSTLMHCVAGLDSLTSGQVFIASVELSQLSDKGLWIYEVSFGPGWQYAGQLYYQTEPAEHGKLGARMSWTPNGGSTSTWFLGIVEANHATHGNTRFPGFFMHAAYFPPVLATGDRLTWEFPWSEADGTRRQGKVRRFDRFVRFPFRDLDDGAVFRPHHHRHAIGHEIFLAQGRHAAAHDFQ